MQFTFNLVGSIELHKTLCCTVDRLRHAQGGQQIMIDVILTAYAKSGVQYCIRN